ncbi:MAG: hypothetical protein Q9219_006739 [cf. Caloplaca sp. 3 TL-2023]
MPSNTRPRAAGSKKNTKSTAAKTPPINIPSQDTGSGTQSSNVSSNLVAPPDPKQAIPPNNQPLENSLHSANGVSATSSAAPGPTVNRKKQKRREKQAARLAAEQQSAAGYRAAQPATDPPYKEFAYGLAEHPAPLNGFDYGPLDYDEADQYEPAEGEDLYYTDDDGHLYERTFGVPSNGFLPHPPLSQQPLSSTSRKKAKGQDGAFSQQRYASPYPTPQATHFRPPPPPPPPPPMSNNRSTHHMTKDRIWNTSTQEERERIKEFWLSLGEEDRRSLVKVEKEAVLKKMKEQQKHSCSCTVCGRKRTAIEEELEALYDAYYDELEQYANHQQISLVDGTPMMPTAALHHSLSRYASNRSPLQANHPRPSRARFEEIRNRDEAEMDDEEYSDEDEDDEFSDEEPEEEPLPPPPQANDFFNFGNSLTVQGGILTVADDLLKNDGKKFIEMMEQLAERRMQREEDAQYAAAAGLSHPAMQSHNQGPPLENDVEYDDEEDEDSYESGEDEEYEDDEMEALTEEQRMEEGRRMFQIFAARMFEQRVLTAYREKVAAERQQKLIEELEEESRLDTQREAKKAKEAQKKKEKKRQLKLKQEEEKAQREAKKAAEEAAARAVEEKKMEEQRQKKEEQRKKKEIEKKAQEEERLRKEAEKQRRLQEARQQQAEQERKQREQKDREKKKREEARKKEREEKEAKEKAAAEKKDQESAEKRESESKAQAAKGANDQTKKREQAVKSSAAVPLAEIPNPKPMRPPAQTRSSHASPHLPIATPAVPKAPTPIRIRQPSYQDPHLPSPKTSQVPSTGSTTSPVLPGAPQSNTGPSASKPAQALPQHPGQTSPFPPGGTSSTFITQPPGLPPMPAMGGPGFPPNFGPMIPGATSRAPMQDPSFGHHHPPMSSPQQRQFMPQGGLPFAPGMNPTRQAPPARVGPMDTPVTQGPPGQVPMGQVGGHNQYVMSRDTMPSHSRSHSRQTSTSLEKSMLENPNIPAMTQPIARPNPIQRPSSVTPQQQSERERPRRSELEDLTNHLGSSALLDDTDVPLTSAATNNPRRGSVAPGPPFRQGFGTSPMFADPIATAKKENLPRGNQGGNANTWGAPHMPFGPPPGAGSPQWTHAPGTGWPTNNAFGIIGSANRPNSSRAVIIRLLICQACNKLTASQPTSHRSGFHPVDAVLRQVELMKPAGESTITLQELLDICDTEGNNQNGGGSFTVESQGDTGTFVKFESGRNTSMSMRGGVPGDIGSPIPGNAFPGFAGLRPLQQPGGLHNPSF